MKDFAGKVVVVTGAGSGIGRATALALSRHGARLHLVDIDTDRVEAVCEEITNIGGCAYAHAIDCADPHAMLALAENIFDTEGRVDILQNGAGVLVGAAIDKLSLKDWQLSVEGNLWTVINGVHAFVPKMLAQKTPAHVVNVASVAGLVGFPYTAAYSTMKFAVVGLSEVLSVELYGRGIVVTAVCPGMVRTNLVANGALHLPGSWPKVIDRAYERFAARPEWLAEQILSAIRHKRSLVVPSIWLAQLWLFKRLAGRVYLGTARELTRALVGLGNQK